MLQAAAEPAADRDLVVFITDGDPTAYLNDNNVPVTDQSSTGQALTDAISAANTVKPGSRILVVGVGNGLDSPDSAQRLRTISGPQMSNEAGLPGKTINNIDVVVVPQFDKLGDFLEGVVTELCAPSVTIQKWVSDPNAPTPPPGIPAGYKPGSGWDFTATPSVTGGTFDWILPNTTPETSKTVTTDVDGNAQFQWEPNPSNLLPPHRSRRRTPAPSDYTPGRSGPNNDWTCSTPNGSDQSGELVRIGQQIAGSSTRTLDVGPLDIVTCDVFNDQTASLELVKTVSPAGLGDPSQWNLSASAVGPSPRVTLHQLPEAPGTSVLCSRVSSTT